MMYLLDTKVLLRSVFEAHLLSDAAKSVFREAETTFAFSTASVWEIGIKHEKHPTRFSVDPLNLLWAAQALGYFEVVVSAGMRLPRRDSQCTTGIHSTVCSWRRLATRALSYSQLIASLHVMARMSESCR